jgi:hypothetical protein
MRRLEDTIRRNLRKIGCEDVDWIHLAQDRAQWQAVVNTVMLGSVRSGGFLD